MKRFLLSNVLLLLTWTSNAQQQVNVSMGASYGNEVYYSFQNGLAKIEPINNWDLAFTVRALDASIRINDMRGIRAFLASNNSNDWNNLDTNGMRAFELNNSTESWEFGALANLGTNHPDYGWGVYNMVTHDVNGSRIFVLQLADGSFKKFFVESMTANQIFTFRLANLDGSNVVTKTVNKTDYTGKNFFYYDIATDSFLDREPVSSNWDMVFKRYLSPIQAGPAVVWYPVMGVQTNIDVSSARVEGMVPNVVDSATYVRNTNDISRIGSNWKSFNNATFQWTVYDTLSYFVSSRLGGVYQLVFNGFGGSSNGDIAFIQSPNNGVGLDESKRFWMNIFPNPAEDYLYISFRQDLTYGTVELVDIQGKVMLKEIVHQGEMRRFDLTQLKNGMYVLRLSSEGDTHIQKIVVQN